MERDNEIYVADNYLGGRVLVFDLNTLAFKRGWGAYGKPALERRSASNDAHARMVQPGGPMAKDFVGHLTLERVERRPRVCGGSQQERDPRHRPKEGKYLVKEFIVAPDNRRSAGPPEVWRSPRTRNSGCSISRT